ncbi:MAG: response regulator [Nitrososphaera sp.]
MSDESVQQKPKVMLVEDNPDVMSVLAGLMSLSGMEPVKARTAAESLDIMQQDGIQAAVINGKIALEKGGLLISRLKQVNPDTRIVVVVDGESDRSRLLRLGCEDFARLPISAQTIIEKVMMLLARKNMAEPTGLSS